MKAKNLFKMFVCLIAVLCLFSSSAYAGTCKTCEYKKSSLSCKFICKAHVILKNKDELGLTDGQVEKVKELKLNTKKELIRTDAEIKIMALDIKAGLYQEAVDAKAVNALVDKKYDLKKAKAKSLVSAYAELKGILDEEQMAKLKDVYSKACDLQKTSSQYSPYQSSACPTCPYKSGACPKSK